jgi:extracellular factor (EF) 3-hydroxypalmitic acid methyl ester biosynthesis protein
MQNAYVTANIKGQETEGAVLRMELGWQEQARLLPEFKLAVLDLHVYLTKLKLLLEEVEMALLSHPSEKRADLERRASEDLASRVVSHIDSLHERFEEAAERIPPEQRAAHQALVRQLLHPLFLCAPFGYRTYRKPLGYAGDYEIMNMIHRNTFEGESLFAKLVHYWFVSQWAAQSVRNRVAHMKSRIVQETLRVALQDRPARILNLGCGPAREVQNFIAEDDISDRADFTLVDFDAETLDFVSSTLQQVALQAGRRTRFRVEKFSVCQMLRCATQPSRSPFGTQYDLVYCGGLFDYFSDQVCQQLVGMFYHWLAPGGRVVVANMHEQRKPFRYMLELLLDWHLIYRDASCMSSFLPDEARREEWTVFHEPVAANLFLEARKPQAR